MAIKYKRGDDRGEPFGVRHPGPLARRRWGIKRQLILIYIGIAAFAGVLYASMILFEPLAYSRRTPQQSLGRVVDKAVERDAHGVPRYRVTIEAALPDGELRQGDVYATPEFYDQLEHDMPVAVEYLASPWRPRIRVLRLGPANRAPPPAEGEPPPVPRDGAPTKEPSPS